MITFRVKEVSMIHKDLYLKTLNMVKNWGNSQKLYPLIEK